MTSWRAPRVLVIGYGNPGRLDDGLGPAVAAALDTERPLGVTVEADYQLTVEHAAMVAEHDVTILVDATVKGPDPFSFERVAATEGPSPPSFSTHSVEPVELVGLARDLFGATGETWILAIRGWMFDEFGERLSPRATRNLEAALEFLHTAIESRDFAAAAEGVRHRAAEDAASEVGASHA